MNLGEFIKLSRKKKGLTHWGLFRKSEVSVSYIKAIENNVSSPNPEILKKLAVPLGVKYLDLLQAAGYLDDAVDISEAIKLKFGILFRDQDAARILTVPGVKEILEDIHSLPESRRESAIKTIRSLLDAMRL